MRSDNHDSPPRRFAAASLARSGRCRPRALRQVQGIKFGLYKSVSIDVTGTLFELPSGMSVVNFETHEGAP